MQYRAIVFLALLLCATGYVCWRLWHILPFAAPYKTVAVMAFAGGMVLMMYNLLHGLDTLPLGVAQWFYDIGYSWPIVLLFLFIIFILLDLGRLTKIVPDHFLLYSWEGTISVVLVMIGLFVYGNVNYHVKQRVVLDMKTTKVSRPLTVVMMSDLHLGYHNTRETMAKWVSLVNGEEPDLILIAGDIIDISVRPLIEEGVAEEFRRLKAPVYACLGNHEYYSGEPLAQKFYRDAGIHLLCDSSTVVGDLCIIGRDDRTNTHRKPLGALMKGVDTTKYTILLDHQPYALEQAERCGIDMQLSGHTHYGQVWPASWITRAVYECAYGSHQRGNTHYYVSSGIGIWGGKYRIGTRSEYVVITIHNS